MKKYFLLFFSFLIVTNCQSPSLSLQEEDLQKIPESIPSAPFLIKPEKEKTEVTPKSISTLVGLSEFKSLNLPGNQFSPHLSADDRLMTYASSQRNTHPHQEVYIYDFTTEKEKRWSFQGGKAFQPQFHPHHPKLLYSSTNIEVVSNPALYIDLLKETESKKQKSLDLPASEIVMRDLNTKAFQQMTQSGGYDGEASFIKNGRRILFTSVRKTKKNMETQVFSVDLRGRQLKKVTSLEGYNGQARITSDGKRMVHVQKKTKDSFSALVFSSPPGKKYKTLPLPKGLHFSPTWDVSERWIFFSSQLVPNSETTIYVVHESGNCLYQVDSGYALHPQINAAGDKLFYTRWNGKHWTLGWREFSLPQTCVIESP